MDGILNSRAQPRTFKSIEQLFLASQSGSTNREPGPPARTLPSIHGLSSRAAAKTRQMFPRRNIWTGILALREVSKPSIIVEFILGIDLDQLLEVELVSQHGANAAEAFDELVALARTV